MAITCWHRYPDEKPDDGQTCWTTMILADGKVFVGEWIYNGASDSWFWPNYPNCFHKIIAWVPSEGGPTPEPYIPTMHDVKEAGFTSINFPQENGWYICKHKNGKKMVCYFVKDPNYVGWATITDEGHYIKYVAEAIVAYKPLIV